VLFDAVRGCEPMPVMKSGDAFLMPRPPADPTVLVPTSAVLQRLHDEVPADYFTLALQLPICFEVRALSGSLVSSTPE
jgi:hypothetical protein